MRLLSAVVVVAAVLVACTNKVVIVEAHPCSQTFSGTWHVVDTLQRQNQAGCEVATQPLDANADAQLSRWIESGTTQFAVTVGEDGCTTMSVQREDRQNDGTLLLTVRSLRAEADGSLSGSLSNYRFRTEEYDANKGRGTPLCTSSATTVATR
jgi:hypothetical protein